MTDTIAESFCERCGTRYSFEQRSKGRRARFGRVRVLTKGLTTFVSNDGMPLAEAIAAARDDEERAELARQLDAFHETFSFCLGCRQYTCRACWNAAAGQCLTCAPDPSREVLPMPAAGPPLTPEAGVTDGIGPRLEASAWPEADLLAPAAAGAPSRGVEQPPLLPPAATPPSETTAAEPEPLAAPEAPELAAEAEPELVPEPALLAAPESPPVPSLPASAELGELTADELSAIELALTQVRQAAKAAELIGPDEPAGAPDELAEVAAPPAETAPDQLADVAAPPAETALEQAAAVAPQPAETAPDAVPALPAPASGQPDHAAAARDRTRRLLGRFRPARAAAPTPVTPRPETTDQPAPPEPPVDAVGQPTWQIVAPDALPPPDAPPPALPDRQGPPARPPAWPEATAWPSGPPASPRPAADTAPWTTRLALSRPEAAGVWAASSREVLGGPARPGAAPAVQACISCGLPLSATARFCRRCGTRQG